MPSDLRFPTYALRDWTVQRRKTGWYYARTATAHLKEDWRGPYTSEASVTLMLAREFLREIRRRHIPASPPAIEPTAA